MVITCIADSEQYELAQDTEKHKICQHKYNYTLFTKLK